MLGENPALWRKKKRDSADSAQFWFKKVFEMKAGKCGNRSLQKTLRQKGLFSLSVAPCKTFQGNKSERRGRYPESQHTGGGPVGTMACAYDETKL